jgi:aerobic carbon-monoxide dehydrogenase medium subunit
MKAAPFAYARATSVDNALELLAAHGDRAKVISGGQSLMPAMNLRLLSPELLVDIGELSELRGVAASNGKLRLGALTRHAELLKSPEVATHAPLLTEAVAHVAHPAIRNRGTLGGSLAHADPASELPACMLALDATIIVRSPDEEHRIAATDFFKGIYETALRPDDLLVAVEVPIRQQNSAFFFHELARRRGDYAIVGIAVQAIVEDGVFKSLRAAFFAIGDRPVLVKTIDRLVDSTVTPALLVEVSAALDQELDPHDDQQASSAMRRHLAKLLLSRSVSALLRRPDLEARTA